MDKMELEGAAAVTVERSSSIRVRDGARADIFIRPKKSADISVAIGRGCDVRAYVVMESAPKLNLTMKVGEASVANSASAYLCGARVDVKSILAGKGARAYGTHVFIQKGSMEFSLDSLLEHAAKGTEGDVLVKGVVAGKAGAALGGLIKIGKNACGAKSHLGEHVIILGDEAHASANPALEIENNEVASRHSASVSRIDNEKIFYLMSRGMPQSDAEMLIVEGFLDSPLLRIPDGKIRDEFMRIVRNALLPEEDPERGGR